ncbi:MAG TPA: arylsulfotransferase family protein [Solirubrobacteraceae bacterium]|nr:arylsulfotransferase family protein [Solirubrobacteraceae bacterium]
MRPRGRGQSAPPIEQLDGVGAIDGRLTRRGLLKTAAAGGVAVAGLAGAGYAGYRWPRATEAPPAEPDVLRFVSRPDLRPPALSVTRAVEGRRLRAAPHHLLLAPKGYTHAGPGQPGPMIVDRSGRLVWFLPRPDLGAVPMNLKVQRYRGAPVLTWWEGRVSAGHGDGIGLVYDAGYRQIATVRATDGLSADLHELLLTDRDSALLIAYRPARADLTAVGGPRDGWVHEGVVQEVDVASGKALFTWRSLDHVPVEETYAEVGAGGTEAQPFDYAHLNSIDVAPDGDLVVSARNTCAIYKLSRTSGEVAWRLGGRRSDLELADDARFYYQHDARALAGDRLSLFDDGSSPQREPQSRGLILRLDHAGRRAEVEREYAHPARLLADNQGSTQVLPDGSVLVGWGSQPYTSLFDRAGDVLIDARLPVNDQSYRAFTATWVGRPTEPPRVAVGPNSARGLTVYASWNGATEVRHWRILAGPAPSSLRREVTVRRTGFETAVVVDADGPYFAAEALDARERPLGRSQAMRATT